MATQEIPTETEPVEKEIQPVEKEIQPMDVEIISLEIREIIRRALERHLNTEGVKYEVISYTDSPYAERDENNLKGNISLANDNSNRVIPYTWYENEHMIYNEIPAHRFTVYISTAILPIHDRRYLYFWTHQGRYYAMAPYFVLPSAKEDSVILCSDRLDVTKAVHSKDPEKAIEEALKQLTNRSNKEKGFNKEMYHWDSDGSDDNFTVSKPTTKKKEDSWYWKAEEKKCITESKGKMVLTTLPAQMAHLNFDQI